MKVPEGTTAMISLPNGIWKCKINVNHRKPNSPIDEEKVIFKFSDATEKSIERWFDINENGDPKLRIREDGTPNDRDQKQFFQVLRAAGIKLDPGQEFTLKQPSCVKQLMSIQGKQVLVRVGAWSSSKDPNKARYIECWHLDAEKDGVEVGPAAPQQMVSAAGAKY